MSGQLDLLDSMPESSRATLLQQFASLQLPAALAGIDWVNDPASYLDALTAAVWSSGEMPRLRQAAIAFAAALPTPQHANPPQRQVFAVLDASLGGRAAFAKLRPHGVTLHVPDAQGWDVLRDYVQQRATALPRSYGHWLVDGANAPGTDGTDSLITVSYDALQPVRERLLSRALSGLSPERTGPEQLRSLLVHTTPEQIGMPHSDATLAHFQLSLLTEGSGTQIFSTTFVQWAARECLRRAEPDTLLLRWTPRQAQQDMNEMLTGAPSIGPDAPGSLVDAEQAAYYTWINSSRLAHAESAVFLAWHASSGMAVAIGPGMARGATSRQPQSMTQALKFLS